MSVIIIDQHHHRQASVLYSCTRPCFVGDVWMAVALDASTHQLRANRDQFCHLLQLQVQILLAEVLCDRSPVK